MYSEFPPGKNLSQLVNKFVCLDIKDSPGHYFAPAVKRLSIIVAVKSNIEVTFNNDTFIPPLVSMRGIFETPSYLSYLGGEGTAFMADLNAIGMYELTGKPGIAFKNKFVDALSIWPENEVSELFTILSRDTLFKERTQFFGDFLAKKKPKVLSEKSILVEKANNMAHTNLYQQNVKSICHELGVSEKSLGRAFKEVLGILPKQYFTIALFEEMVKQYAINKESSITDFLESPFYDFSHINKWFKKYAHTSPREFVNLDMHVVGAILSGKDSSKAE